jgi:hypothetical protein
MLTWTQRGSECAFVSGMSEVGCGNAKQIYGRRPWVSRKHIHKGRVDSKEGSLSGKKLYCKIEVYQ